MTLYILLIALGIVLCIPGLREPYASTKYGRISRLVSGLLIGFCGWQLLYHLFH
jgi:hypothetical protein